MAKSILKNKRSNPASNTNRGVSFSSNNQQQHLQQQSNERLRMMNDDEEDAFDPSSSSNQESLPTSIQNLTGDDISSQQIRDLKSKRAMQRVAGDETTILFEDDASSKKQKKKKRGMFDGEEEIDEQYSLLHDDDATAGGVSNENSEKEHDDTSCPIEPFNMTSEREDGMGYFEGDTYVFRRGKGEEEEDAWLDQLKEQQSDSQNAQEDAFRNIEKGSESANKSQTKKSKVFDQLDQLTQEQVYDLIVPLLATENETVIQALGRYGNIIKREAKQRKQMLRKQKQNEQSGNEIDQVESSSTKALNQLTELSNLCMMKFDDNSIYDRDRQYFTKFLAASDELEAKKRKRSYFSSELGSENTSVDNNQKRSRIQNSENSTTEEVKREVQWEYRGNEDNAIHGPYSTQQMMEWIKAGYFVGAMAVDVRIVKSEETPIVDAKSKEEVVDDLLGDLEDSDNEDEGEKVEATNPWQRSDQVNFEQYTNK